MDAETIVYYIIALLLGILLANILKNVCGSVEGLPSGDTGSRNTSYKGSCDECSKVGWPSEAEWNEIMYCCVTPTGAQSATKYQLTQCNGTKCGPYGSKKLCKDKQCTVPPQKSDGGGGGTTPAELPVLPDNLKVDKCKLLIGQNNIEDFIHYKSKFPDKISGGSVYIGQPGVTPQTSPCRLNPETNTNNQAVVFNDGQWTVPDGWPWKSEACHYPGNWPGKNFTEHYEVKFLTNRKHKNKEATPVSLDEYLTEIKKGVDGEFYCEVAMGFKYCGMGDYCPNKTEKNERSKTYERWLDGMQNDGDFSYVEQIAKLLLEASNTYGITWLFRFEYEVAIDVNGFGYNKRDKETYPAFIEIKRKYARAFLNSRKKMKEIFGGNSEKLQFIFHVNVGDSIKLCSSVTEEQHCQGGGCIWDGTSCKGDWKEPCPPPTGKFCDSQCVSDLKCGNSQADPNSDWITIFKDVGPTSLDTDHLPDLLGQSQVFGDTSQYNMVVTNFIYWKIRTGRKTIMAETSIASPTDDIDICNTNGTCTSLGLIMDLVRKHKCLDFLVYINSMDNIDETTSSSDISLMKPDEIRENWLRFIDDNVE